MGTLYLFALRHFFPFFCSPPLLFPSPLRSRFLLPFRYTGCCPRLCGPFVPRNGPRRTFPFFSRSTSPTCPFTTLFFPLPQTVTMGKTPFHVVPISRVPPNCLFFLTSHPPPKLGFHVISQRHVYRCFPSLKTPPCQSLGHSVEQTFARSFYCFTALVPTTEPMIPFLIPHVFSRREPNDVYHVEITFTKPLQPPCPLGPSPLFFLFAPSACFFLVWVFCLGL